MDFWNQAPFIRLIFPLIAGVIVGIETNIEAGFTFVFLAGLGLSILFTGFFRLPFGMVRHGEWQGLLVYAFIFFGGIALTDSTEDIRHPEHFSKHLQQGETGFLARVIEPIQPKEKTYKMVVQVEHVKDGERWKESRGRMLVYLRRDSGLTYPQYGDYLLMNARVQPIEGPKNPSQFDYRRYLRNKQIHHQAFLQSNSWQLTGASGGNPLYHLAFSLRKELLDGLESLFDDERDLAVASALLLGYKEKLDRDVLLSYSSAGAMHVLAVSGLHVGIIFLVLDILLRFMDRQKRLRLIKALLLVAGLWTYAMLTGLSPSVERSATMFSFIVIGKLIGRSTSVYNTLAASAFLLILLNPYIITEVGFQLSYIAVLGIVFIQPRLYNLRYFRNKIMDRIWAITCVSIAAQIATFPLGIYYFHQFPNYFLISNLFVIPMASVILYAGFLYFLSMPFGDDLAHIVGVILRESIGILNNIISYIEQMPYALTYGISATIVELLLLYFVIIALMAYFRFRLKVWLFTGLSFIAALLGYQFTQVLEHNKQQIFAVFDVRNSTAINVISGRNNYLFAGEELLADEDKLLFHMRHFWFDRRTDNEQGIPIHCDTVIDGISSRDGFIAFESYAVLRIDTSFNFRVPSSPLQVDYLILSENARIWLERWLEMVNCRVLIIDSSNKRGKAKYWKDKALKAGVKVHNVQEDGAYVEYL